MLDTLLELGAAILLLIFLSAFFSSAETALTAASDAYAAIGTQRLTTRCDC